MSSTSTAPAEQRTPLNVVPPAAGHGIDYELFLDCVHCGLCTSACPTYVELGTEMDSPRGRIYLMRAVTDGRLDLNADVRRHLDLCLDCRACESACPSGVQYGKLIEPFRIHMAKTLPASKRVINGGTVPGGMKARARFTYPTVSDIAWLMFVS